MTAFATFDVAVASFRGARQAGKIARAEQRANRRTTAVHTVTTVGARIRRMVLTVGALSSFTVAAADVPHWPAWVVGGLCALYLEQSMSDD